MNDTKKEHFTPLEVNVKRVKISQLKPHPQNYREHPDDQLEHIIESIKLNGIYRNLVVANDYTILAGHGVIKACSKMGIEEVPVAIMNFGPDDPKAIILLTGDNEISKLGVVDDRKLTELLKGISDQASLLGTGFDDKMLANLLFVSRPASEIASLNEASEYIGMPEFELSPAPIKTIISFESQEDKDKLYNLMGVECNDKKTDSIWFPEKERMDLVSVKIEVPDESSIEETQN